jgi:hypothetical protein
MRGDSLTGLEMPFVGELPGLIPPGVVEVLIVGVDACGMLHKVYAKSISRLYNLSRFSYRTDALLGTRDGGTNRGLGSLACLGERIVTRVKELAILRIEGAPTSVSCFLHW